MVPFGGVDFLWLLSVLPYVRVVCSAAVAVAVFVFAPCIVDSFSTVLEVATEMSLKRTDAALLTKRGRVVGIVTDHDLTMYVLLYPATIPPLS